MDWQAAYGGDATVDVPSVEGLTSDGKAVVLRTHGASGWSRRGYNLADGTTVATSLPDDDVAGLITDPLSERIIGYETADSGIAYTFLNADDKERCTNSPRRSPAKRSSSSPRATTRRSSWCA